MDFKINENQKMISDMIQKYGEKSITPFVKEWDESQTFPVQVFKDLEVSKAPSFVKRGL